jgi:hypothetical protein
MSQIAVIAVGVAILVAVVAGRRALEARARRVAVTYANEREERLTRQLSRVVGCSLADALPSVRKELEIAPDQTDETLLNRAAYHYRQALPEKACPVYPERAPG